MSLQIVSDNPGVTPVERWQAIAWAIVKAKAGTDFEAALQMLYQTLTPAEQCRCRTEIFHCRQAIRGEIVAEIVEESTNV